MGKGEWGGCVMAVGGWTLLIATAVVKS